jgi:group I intron endonuclease
MIRHDLTGRMYIGSSKDVEKRTNNHLGLLRNGNHPVEDMQKDFNEYGDCFSVSILETITDYSEKNKEYEWMMKYNSHIRGDGYNYKDKAKVQLQTRVAKKDNKEELHKLIDTLTANQIIFVLTFLKNILGKEDRKGA